MEHDQAKDAFNYHCKSLEACTIRDRVTSLHSSRAAPIVVRGNNTRTQATYTYKIELQSRVGQPSPYSDNHPLMDRLADREQRELYQFIKESKMRCLHTAGIRSNTVCWRGSPTP